MEIDIKNKILKDFGTEAEKAINLLSGFDLKYRLGPRLDRCIVQIANGNISKLHETVRNAEIDWRDVITSTESTDFEFDKSFKTK